VTSTASGQQPYFYNHTRTGRPETPEMSEFKARWREIPNEPLYPFGHGLTYSRFEYGDVELSTSELAWGDTLEVRATLTNTGTRAAEEVAQLYIHDRVASRVRPVRELRGFAKVRLEPGERTTVRFTLDLDALAFSGADGVRRAEPGTFDVWIAPNCKAGKPVSFKLGSARG
jgi:beta-glucosidase